MNLIVFIFNIISLLDLWEFYIVQTNSAPISVCSEPPLMPAVPPTKENALKNQDKINKEIKKNQKEQQANTLLDPPFFQSLQHFFIHPGKSGAEV